MNKFITGYKRPLVSEGYVKPEPKVNEAAEANEARNHISIANSEVVKAILQLEKMKDLSGADSVVVKSILENLEKTSKQFKSFNSELKKVK